jgi:Ion channel
MSMTSAPGESEIGMPPEPDAAGLEGPVPRGPRYGLLLILLIGTYLLSAFTSGTLVNAVQIVVFVGTLLLALRSAQVATWIGWTTFGVVAIGSALALGVVLSQPPRDAVGAANIWTGLVLLTVVVVIVHRILGSDAVTLQSIYGAVSVYMIIGLMFAAFYGAMNRLGSSAFFANGQPGDTRTFQYFSFTTLTTLGYGDFTAAGDAGRAVAVLEAMFGQIFLATLVARLVSAFQPARRK